MADKRISQLIERTDIANNDVLPIVASGATTTNKVTISTVQDWMQDNLDLGVTSVGITLGSSGTDVSVTGSPITSSGNITINIPTASATNRGLLSSANWTTFNNKVSSVGLSMPSAFAVANSPITGSGTIAVTGAGTVSQYIRGDGSLADFPSGGGGGGASVNYYLNGSVSQGTIGGIAYLEMNKTPILGAGTDFTIAADGYIASFITDAGDPALLEIPGGNWNFETYFQASSGGGSPTFYVELYKVNSGGTATLIASNSANPELIAFGTTTTPYFSTLAVPTTTLALTDRLALRYYVTHAGRTITLHTENGNLCQIITTFTTGLTALNGLTAQVQNFATGTSGTDFGISSASTTHTFNLPTASATNRGALSSADWTTFNGKQNTLTNPVTGTGAAGRVAYWNGAGTITSDSLFQWNDTFKRLGIGRTPTVSLDVTGAGFFSSSVTANSLIKTGGTSSEFLKADGSVDSNAYALNSSLSLYLPLTGGTISGQLNVGSGSLRIAAEGAANITILRNFTGTAQGQSGFNNIGFNNSNNFYFTKNLNNGAIFAFTNTAYQTYTLPDASGTIALTSSLGAYLPLTGGTLTGALNGTSAVFSGDLQVGGNGRSTLTIGDASASAFDANIRLRTGSTRTSWLIGAQNNVVGFEITPSTTVGGTTYSTPALSILASTGAATFSSTLGIGTTPSGNDGLFQTNGSNGNLGGGTAKRSATIFSTSAENADRPGIILGYDTAGAGIIAAATQSAGQPLAFWTYNGSSWAERMRITSTGNVGIGTTGAINAASGWTNFVVNGSDRGLIGVKSNEVDFGAMYGNTASNAFVIQAYGTSNSGSMAFLTASTERMRITSVGYLKASNNGVYNNATGTFHELTQNLNGASSAILTHGGTSDPYGLEVNFTGHDPNNATNYMFGAYKTSGGFVWIYRIFSNGTVSARSDARWKKNIETTRNGYIDDLCKLRVVKYNWYNHEDDAPKELGLIAQEVEEVFPNLIQIDPVIAKREVEQEDGTIIEEEFEDGVSRSIKTSVLPFMLLKAMQEQQEQIKELQEQINSLKNQIK